MKDARRNESEAMYKGPYWVFVSVLTGMPLKVEKCTFKPTIHPAGSHGDWIEMWADSHPDTAESDEGPYRYSHPKLKAAFDEGYAHSRKSQAAWDISVKDRITMDDFRRRTEALTTMHEVLLNEAVKAERERIKEELKKSESWKHRRCPSWLEIAIIEILNPKETK